MKRTSITSILTVFVTLIVSGCSSPQPIDPTGMNATLTPAQPSQPITLETITPTHGIPPTAITPPWSSSDGPLLLIQTGFKDYQILDLNRQTTYPFDPPGQNRHYNLAANLSPSRKQMLFPIDDETVVVMDLSTGQVETTHKLYYDSPHFLPEQAAEEALNYFPGEDYSFEVMLAAVKDALIQSKLNIRWFQSDRYWLSVLDTDETSTSLHLDDLKTGVQHKLESMPGLVANYWIGPDGNEILLQKAFVFEPGAWQDNRYYVVNMNAQKAQPIPLPEGIDNPSVFWLEENTIGIIHKTQFTGGVGFSIINTETMESTLMIKDAFTHIHLFGETLFILRQDQEGKTSEVELRTIDGGLIQTQRLNEQCFLNRFIGRQFILNCETESILLDESLQARPFGEPVFILSTAPDRDNIVLVDREEGVYLLDTNLQNRQPLVLEGAPLEIHWLPDSYGFLYRTRGQLHSFDLTSGESHLLLTADILTDYSNINAVWINVD